jgi:dihydrofolate reductase
VRAVEGSIEALIEAAKEAAGGLDVYVDGGTLIRQACEAGLVDDLTITVAPIALGAGHPLFAGLSAPYVMRLVEVNIYHAGMVQLRLVPRSPVEAPAEAPAEAPPAD